MMTRGKMIATMSQENKIILFVKIKIFFVLTLCSFVLNAQSIENAILAYDNRVINTCPACKEAWQNYSKLLYAPGADGWASSRAWDIYFECFKAQHCNPDSLYSAGNYVCLQCKEEFNDYLIERKQESEYNNVTHWLDKGFKAKVEGQGEAYKRYAECQNKYSPFRNIKSTNNTNNTADVTNAKNNTTNNDINLLHQNL